MIAIETSASIAESFLYVYMGLSSFMLSSENVHPRLIIVVLLSTIVARFLSVFIPMILLYFIKKGSLALKWNEILLISIGGIIRGAIAFGLCIGI